MKTMPIKRAPESAGHAADRCGVEELVELDRTVFALDRDNRIAEFNQIFFLHRENLLADRLGFLFG